jgi:hypothetical protein
VSGHFDLVEFDNAGAATRIDPALPHVMFTRAIHHVFEAEFKGLSSPRHE